MSESSPSVPAPLAPRFLEPDAVMDRFLTVIQDRGIEPYPEQEEAILELFSGAHVVLNTPTGSGKSLVAAALHYKALCAGQRSVYTCPIKALVNEKFLALCRDFGPENVGMMTGDASVNAGAPVLCCTAEVLANIALAGGDRSDIRAVIMDEFHYYSDPDRGTAWQVPLLLMPNTQFLLMSATLGATDFIEKELTRVSGRRAMTVSSDKRPVPLQVEYSETPLAEQVQGLLDTNKAPVYIVFFTQRSVADGAQSLMSLNVCSKDEKAALQKALEGVRFNSPYGKEMQRWLRHGIGVHHAGLLPKYRVLVEKLAQRGLLKLICGTDTLGVGINVPIRTVVFSQLWKYDGRKAAVLTVRDFRQVAGRAGRKGYDDVGYVMVQAPEHMIENKRAEAKAAGDPKKMRKLVKKRAPEGSVSWDENTLTKLQSAPSENLTSRFEVTHGMLLQVLSRPEDGCRVMRDLIATCHEPAARKPHLRKRSWQLFRALVERGIVEIRPPAERLPGQAKVKVNVELQADFSLHQALSLYLLDTLPLLDAESPDYPYDVLTLCEAIVEDPDQILRAQLSNLKGDAVAQMKEAGIEYDERMEKLDALEHPKPLREFLYDTFNTFAAAHPWVEQENVKPKSIAREMYERYQSFADYIREYGLQRSEGLLLRHLSQTWKVLSQTVPDAVKTEPLLEMEIYFRELIRSVDSSLLEEWQKLKDPSLVIAAEADVDKPARPTTYDVTRDEKSFARLVRTAIYAFLQAVVVRDWESAVELGGGQADDETLTPRTLENAWMSYADTRGRFRLDPAGRASHRTIFGERTVETWDLVQVLVDADEANDWEARFTVDLTASRAEDRAVIRFHSVGPIGS